MTDYANQDVDRLRIIAKYCNGTEHGVFLDRLADRMEEVVSDVVRPVFTREDVHCIRGNAAGMKYVSEQVGASLEDPIEKLLSIADRIEQALPIEAPTVDVT